MKIIITESQHNFLLEQSDYIMDKRANAIANVAGIRSDKDYQKIDKSIDKAHQGKAIDAHTLMTVLAIGTAFIPVAGPFISAAISLSDAALYYNEGDKKSAGLTAAFSMIPFIGKIPGVKELGSKGMSLLASKIAKGVKTFSPAEIKVLNAVKQNESIIKQGLTNASKKISPITKEIQSFKPTYIKRYGQESYDNLLRDYISGISDKQYFIQTLKSSQKAAPKLANFVTKFGIKFTKNEISQIQKSITNLSDDSVDIITLETKNGPRKISVHKVDGDWVAKNAPQLTNSAGWANSVDNTVFINRGSTQYMNKQSIEDLFMHEFGHIKDPSIIKSPVYQKLYRDKATKGIESLKKAADWEKTDWESLGLTKPNSEIEALKKSGKQNYTLNPQEIIANNTMTLQSLATQTNRWMEILPKEQVLKGLDDIINYSKGNTKSWSREAEWLLGYDQPYIQGHLTTLVGKPSQYRKLWTKLAQQAEYLKSQVNIAM